MALNTNIPLPIQTLGQTWYPINQNFNNIEAAFIVNHVDYATIGAGKHTYVTMPVQTTPPVTLAAEQAIYTAMDVPVTGNPQIFVVPPNAGTPVNITGVYYRSPLPWALGNQGSTQLPSGLILKWGWNSVNTTGTVNFTTAFPTNIFTVQITLSGGVTNATVSPLALNLNNFTMNCSTAATTSFYWFAMGN